MSAAYVGRIKLSSATTRRDKPSGIFHVRNSEPSSFLIVNVCPDDDGEVQGFTRNGGVATPPGWQPETQRDQKNRIIEKRGTSA